MPSRHEHSPQSYAAFAGCCLVWGSTFLVIRVGNDSVPPIWAATLRLMLAAPLLTALTWLSGHALPRGVALRAALWFGVLNFGLGFCLLYWSETSVPSGLAAVFYSTIPLTSSLFARLLGLERLSRWKLMAALVALAGVAVIFSRQLSGGAPRVLPSLAVLSAATFASLSGVMLKRGPRQHPMGANAVAAWAGLLVCGLASWIVGEPHPLPRTWAMLWPILYLATVGSVVAFGLYAWLVHLWPISRLGFIAVVVPVVALLLGALVRHETLHAREVLGAALVFAGLGTAIGADLRHGAQSHAGAGPTAAPGGPPAR